MSDATRDDLARGKRVLKLLEIHYRQQRELERLRNELAVRYTDTVRRLGPVAPASSSSPGKSGDDPRSGAEGEPGPEESPAQWPALQAATSLARDLPGPIREAVVSRLPPHLADEFLDSLFSFDAIPHLSGRDLERVVRRAEKRMLATALLGAPDEYFHAVTRRMSTRAGQMLHEDMESLLASGDLRTRDVQDARTALSSLIRDVVLGD